MALRMGFKIVRFIHRNKFTNVGYIKTFSSQNTKLKFSNHPKKAVRTLSQQVLPPRKITNKNVEQKRNSNEIESPPIDISKTPLIIPSELENEPVTIRRRFAKSSTQIALTQPLKLPRLANPFPDPVKTLRSDTVSDSEKARLAQEEVKMEARFHLQMQQEKLLENNSYNMYEVRNNNVEQLNQPKQYQEKNLQQFQQQSKQPKFRKPKEYTELLNEDRSTINQCEMKHQKKLAVNSPENHAEEKKGKRPRGNRSRRKAHTRAARYLRHSWYPRHVRRQQREYSTSTAINPELMSDIEQCDILLRRLKALYPEYQDLEKPLFIPGSEEEKEFIKHILKLYAKHKNEPSNRNPAPVPSYSEVKTFKREFKGNNVLNKDSTNNVTLNIGNGTRFCSTNTKDDINISITRKPCPKFKLLGKAPVQRISAKKVILRKKKAPYPAYSELCEITLGDEPAENTFCPWKSDVSSLLKTKTYKKYYSTSAGQKTVEIEKQAKKKVPCKNPFPNVPVCDYVKQAEKQSERKRKKHCPKKRKPCGNDKSASASSDDSGKIISKIKTWLSSYKPESSNIKVTRSAIDVDGRETYIIDVCECEEVAKKEKPNYEFTTEIVEIIQPPPDVAPVRNPFVTIGSKRMPFKNVEYKPIELKDSPTPEMTQPLPVLTKNIPEFISHSASNLTPQKKSEELKITQAVPTKQPIPAKGKQLADRLELKSVKQPAPIKKIPAKIDLKSVRLQTPQNIIPDKIEMKSVQSRIPVKMTQTKLELKPVKKIPSKLELEPEEAKTNIEIKPKEIVINKVKESLIVKPKGNSKINVVKSNFFKDNKSKDFKLLNVKNSISNPFKEFKVNEMTENSNEPCPLLSRSKSKGGCHKDPGCSKDLVGGCKKKKKEQVTKRRCRTPKKRKLPSCDDVKQKKKPKCAPFSIPGLEDKPEYYINAPKKTYFKKSDNISNFIDLKTEDIEILANQKPPKKEDNEPFKLKPQFWKKHRNRI